MLKPEDNERLVRVGPGTPAGTLFRRYWQPALLSGELPEADGAPVRVRLLGENLIAFRDSEGQVGLVDAFCPHRRAPLFFGRNEDCGLRCVYHGWKFDRHGNCVDMPSEPAGSPLQSRAKIVVDRSKEFLGTTDRAIVTMRRLLLEATRAVERGEDPPGLAPSAHGTVRAHDGVVQSGADWRSAFASEGASRW